MIGKLINFHRINKHQFYLTEETFKTGSPPTQFKFNFLNLYEHCNIFKQIIVINYNQV